LNSPAVYVALAATVIVAVLFVFLAVRYKDQQNSPTPQLRTTGIPSSLSTPLANVMGLTPVPHSKAKDFSLTDQKGHVISLSQFKGRAVVLEFMDPHCTDIRPIVSQELVDACHDLGPATAIVVFLHVNVNVNQYHYSVAAVNAFSNEHSLNTISSWHFLTGLPTILKPVWADYGIAVDAPSRNADIIHTSLI
jgi:cytochrome oxidase Cu insertion factor (SCO1/SenC/PrrC family)